MERKRERKREKKKKEKKKEKKKRKRKTEKKRGERKIETFVGCMATRCKARQAWLTKTFRVNAVR
jgi:hypothetical protein